MRFNLIYPIRALIAAKERLLLEAGHSDSREGSFRHLATGGWALGTSALAVAVMWLGGTYLEKAPFIIYFFAVLVSAFFGGWQSGLVTVAATAGCAAFVTRLETTPWNIEDTIGTLTYIGICMLMICLLRQAQIAANKRRQAEGELQQLTKELESRIAQRTLAWEQANADLEAFAYSVSHDLRTPLRAIDGYTRIIRDDYGMKLDPKALFYLESVCVNTTRMGQMINDLLTFSRLNRKHFSKSVVDMQNLAQVVSDELLALEPARQVQFSIQDLPKCSGDLALLRQVLTNLISNALKFTRRTPVAMIEVGASGTADEIVYYVRDNGVGFDPNYANKLFKVFQRLHKAEEFEGTGVGLSIVQRIIQRHGGRVWAEGKPKTSACFYFTLPIEKEAQQTGARQPTETSDTDFLHATERPPETVLQHG